MRNAKLGKEPSNKGKIWITDGIKNKYVSKDFELPNGWRYGMVHHKGK